MESSKISSINPFFRIITRNKVKWTRDSWPLMSTLLLLLYYRSNRYRETIIVDRAHSRERVRNIIKNRHLLNKGRYLTRCHLFTLNYSFCKCFLFFIGRYLIVRFLSSYSRLSFLFYFAFLFEQLEGFGVEINFTLSFRLKGEQW